MLDVLFLNPVTKLNPDLVPVPIPLQLIPRDGSYLQMARKDK